MSQRLRLLGLDPGLRKTGWGIIEVEANRLTHIANGSVTSDGDDKLADRLVQLFDGLQAVIAEWQPQAAAVEETFVNKNPLSTLKLGQARGVALLVPALSGLPVFEYSPNLVKKTVVGTGHAAKEQIHAMVSVLLPGVKITGPDAADALAVAICHAHHRGVTTAYASMIQTGAAADPAKGLNVSMTIGRRRG
jgi:crossover junction endodeoxyribonuclease RuvC